MTADVIVVGGGPAGATAALLLARAGCDVRLLERSAFPRAKACGDCISAGAAPLLRRLGLLDPIRRLRPARLAGWRIRTAGGACLEVPFERDAFALPRADLDALLLESARNAGARIETGTRVMDVIRDARGAVTGVETNGAAHRARLVIAADGLRSTIARRAGLVARGPRLRKVSLTAHVRGLDGDDWGELHLDRGVTLGIAPVEPAAGNARVFNVTLVLTGGTPPRDAPAFLAHVRNLPGMRRRFARAEATDHGGRVLLASGPFDWSIRTPTVPGLALAGDAAGYFDPLTGQGVMHALGSAELVAAEALAALNGAHATPCLRSYHARLRRRMLEAHALQRVIDFVTSRPALADAAVARLAGRPGAARALLGAISGAAAPRSLLSLRVLASFLDPSRRRSSHAC